MSPDERERAVRTSWRDQTLWWLYGNLTEFLLSLKVELLKIKEHFASRELWQI
jgi:hypothetical protein